MLNLVYAYVMSIYKSTYKASDTGKGLRRYQMLVKWDKARKEALGDVVSQLLQSCCRV